MDKQTANGIFSYNWKPRQNTKYNIDLFNVQYVRNLNPSNYFRVYQNSFNRLENIALSFNQTPTNYIFTNALGENFLIDEYADETIDFLISNSNSLFSISNFLFLLSRFSISSITKYAAKL